MSDMLVVVIRPNEAYKICEYNGFYNCNKVETKIKEEAEKVNHYTDWEGVSDRLSSFLHKNKIRMLFNGLDDKDKTALLHELTDDMSDD